MPRHLGSYELLKHLATGGMAELFVGRDQSETSLGRIVVIKRVLPHLARDARFVDMFVQEARFIAGLTHPNVVQIHELNRHKDAFFIALEYVPGITLRELLRLAAKARRRIPLGVAVGLIAQACAGAHAAHELSAPDGSALGLVHRDISPHNLMVTRDGHLKLLDFGIAKATEVADEKTRTGALKGKIHYMSPEQCNQGDLDRRSDVFALGIVLWELCTQRRLFKRQSDLLTMQAIVGGDLRDPRAVRPRIPASLASAILDALQVDPDDRYPTAQRMRQALLDAAEDGEFDCSDEAIGTFVDELAGEEIEAEEEAIRTADVESRKRTPTDIGGPIKDVQSLSLSSETIPPWATQSGQRSGPGFALAIVAILIAALAAGAWLYRSGKDDRPVTSGPTIAFGWAPIMDPDVLRSELEPLRLYLERHTGRPVEVDVAKSYGALVEKAKRGDVNFAMLPPGSFLDARQATDVELLATKRFAGSAGYDGVLLVRESSDIREVRDLKGRELCIPDPRSTSGWKMVKVKLMEAGLHPKLDVELHESGNHLQTLRDLIAGVCEAAGTYTGVYRNADEAGLSVAPLRVLAITGHSPQDAVVATSSTSPDDRRLIKEALLRFDPRQDLGTETVGNIERISGFSPPDAKRYDDLETLLNASKTQPKSSTKTPRKKRRRSRR